jgi:hypothetical protein
MERIRQADPPVILLDNPFIEPYTTSNASPTGSFWRGRPAANWFPTVDRPMFNALSARCRRVTPEPEPGIRTFAFYDCAAGSFR